MSKEDIYVLQKDTPNCDAGEIWEEVLDRFLICTYEEDEVIKIDDLISELQKYYTITRKQ